MNYVPPCPDTVIADDGISDDISMSQSGSVTPRCEDEQGMSTCIAAAWQRGQVDANNILYTQGLVSRAAARAHSFVVALVKLQAHWRGFRTRKEQKLLDQPASMIETRLICSDDSDDSLDDAVSVADQQHDPSLASVAQKVELYETMHETVRFSIATPRGNDVSDEYQDRIDVLESNEIINESTSLLQTDARTIASRPFDPDGEVFCDASDRECSMLDASIGQSLKINPLAPPFVPHEEVQSCDKCQSVVYCSTLCCVAMMERCKPALHVCQKCMVIVKKWQHRNPALCPQDLRNWIGRCRTVVTYELRRSLAARRIQKTWLKRHEGSCSIGHCPSCGAVGRVDHGSQICDYCSRDDGQSVLLTSLQIVSGNDDMAGDLQPKPQPKWDEFDCPHCAPNPWSCTICSRVLSRVRVRAARTIQVWTRRVIKQHSLVDLIAVPETFKQQSTRDWLDGEVQS